MSAGWVATTVSAVLTLGLWFCSMLILRATPLAGAVFLLASFALTVVLAGLGWSVLTLWGRLRPHRGS
jgi:hypothetical protein